MKGISRGKQKVGGWRKTGFIFEKKTTFWSLEGKRIEEKRKKQEEKMKNSLSFEYFNYIYWNIAFKYNYKFLEIN